MSGDSLLIKKIQSSVISWHENETPLKPFNPLICLLCGNQMRSPVTLACHHSFCGHCATGLCCCPLCQKSISQQPRSDGLIEFLLKSASEAAQLCANCDTVSPSMYFCETCQQSLCEKCKLGTHSAKMFSSHKILRHEERVAPSAAALCPTHQQPLILYSMQTRQTACISCFHKAAADSRSQYIDLDIAHKIGCGKLDKMAGKIQHSYKDIKDQFLVRNRLINELGDNYMKIRENVHNIYQNIIDTLLQARDKLLSEIEDERKFRDTYFRSQISDLYSMVPNIHLVLLGCSIVCSSASVVDFLTLQQDLICRMNSVISSHKQLTLDQTAELNFDITNHFLSALQPFFGAKNRVGFPSSRSKDPLSSSGGYVNSPVILQHKNKYQLLVDISGAFAEEYIRIEKPLRDFTKEYTVLSHRMQEFQRDITWRRCLVPKFDASELNARCRDLDERLQTHSQLIGQIHPALQQLWEEQLDRTHRQQQLYRDKVNLCERVKVDTKSMKQALGKMTAYIATMGSLPPVELQKSLAVNNYQPMNQICQQIASIEPNSRLRVDAIEKEEEKRRILRDVVKERQNDALKMAKKNLKLTNRNSVCLDSPSSVKIVSRDRENVALNRQSLCEELRRNFTQNPSPAPVGTKTEVVVVSHELNKKESKREGTDKVKLVRSNTLKIKRSAKVPVNKQDTEETNQELSSSLPDDIGSLKAEPNRLDKIFMLVNGNKPCKATLDARQKVLRSLKEKANSNAS